MNKIITCLLACIPLLLLIQKTSAQELGNPPIFKTSDTQAIIAKTGQEITVKGMVTTVRKSNSGTNFINFENSEFYLVTFKSDLEAFEKGEPADLYRGQHIAVTGVVSLYKGKTQMKLNHPGMIKVSSADEPVPATEKAGKNRTAKEKTEIKQPETVTPEKKKKKAPVDAKKYFK